MVVVGDASVDDLGGAKKLNHAVGGGRNCMDKWLCFTIWIFELKLKEILGAIFGLFGMRE
ncbi:hypothetical protein LR48_Vigan01g069000 [Vigna angularis]|uniref:Uncharacterized protein n=1 Tax=Phaseolus angularis TaxID=3914 RepID=A0A0L9TKQ7_PHAAN|nr:hypothetical protein LR48_Vigan01g069000 [Vigna angularis]